MESFYSLLNPLVAPLAWLLEMIHQTTGLTWGWSIVILTVIVRLALLPLTVKQQQSFRAMQSLQPELKKLQVKHKNDRQKLNEETMAFYRENKVNPFGSCLPLLVQLPIFFALYLTLRDLSKEIQVGDDLSMLWGWIPNITESLNALPTSTLYPLMIIYVLSQMGSTLLMPTSMDPKQKYIFLFLPIVFGYFIVSPPFGAASFPTGLLVYWITTNIWTCGQAAVIRVWFPPPLMASSKTQLTKPRGSIGERLGVSKSTPNQMPKAKKRKDSTPSAVVDQQNPPTEAKPQTAPPRNRSGRQKRPIKPPQGSRKNS